MTANDLQNDADVRRSIVGETPFADTIRLLWFESLRLEGTLVGLVAARNAAEAVCAFVASTLPADEAEEILGAHRAEKRLQLLEGRKAIPREICSELRDLLEAGDFAVPAASITRVVAYENVRRTMASFADVVAWVTSGRSDRWVSNAEPALRDDQPVPTLRERRRLRQLPATPVLTDASFRFGGGHAVHPGLPHRVQFARLLAFYEESIAVVAAVARIVLRRETYLDVESLRFDQLLLNVALLSRRKPTRAPLSLLLDLEALVGLRTAVERARDRDDDPAQYVAQAKAQNVAGHAVDWFMASYLGSPTIERRWLQWLSISVLVLVVALSAWELGVASGAARSQRPLPTEMHGEFNGSQGQ